MVLMNDFRAEPLELREAMLAATRRVIESGWYVLGNEGTAFEKQWADICGANHGIGVGNGMDAIEIALRGLDIGPGDEVITTSVTAFATVLAIIRAGAIPVLGDIDPETSLLSIESATRCLSSKTKAVVLVHLYGQLRNMPSWLTFCRQHNIQLIEDCAQAHLASWNGHAAGSFGVAGAFSFYPTKNLGAIGDAGLLVTSDDKLAKRAYRLRNYGQSTRYFHPEIGLNSRLDELQAAILSERIKWLPKFTERRREIATAYREGINNTKIRLLIEPETTLAHVYHLYVITCDDRDQLQEHLRNHQIQSLIHYPLPIYEQEPCKRMKRDPQGLPASERHAACCLSLPCHPQMNDEEVARVITAANLF